MKLLKKIIIIVKIFLGDQMKKIFILMILLLPIKVHGIKYYDNFEKNKKYANTDGYDIYISNKLFEVNSNNYIFILDDRKNNNIKIVDSYKIHKLKTKNNIIEVILNYNKTYPNNNWIRTKYSMKNEWIVHNILYIFNIKRERTKDVDFEYKEENIYNFFKYYLQKK